MQHVQRLRTRIRLQLSVFDWRRSVAPERTAKLKLKIQRVHAKAHGLFDGKERWPNYTAMAKEIARDKTLEFDEGTIRQILNGTYPPAKKMNIGRFEPQLPSKR